MPLMDKIAAPLISRNMAFAATFGNHDMSRTCNPRAMSEYMWSRIKGVNGRKLSFTTSSVAGPNEVVGTSNYCVPVYSSTGGDKPELAMVLWFFDSKGGSEYGKTDARGEDISVPNWVDDKVTSWFLSTSTALRAQHNRVIPSLAFVHIPVHAMLSYQSQVHSHTTSPGINAERIGAQGDNCATGKCPYTGADTPFMRALIDTEGLMGVFSGHDHGVDWCMKWARPLPGVSPAEGKGLNVCFNRRTGFGGYGEWMGGTRQVVVSEDVLRGEREVETWVRLEDGTVQGRVRLNGTFGTDVYPVVEKRGAV